MLALLHSTMDRGENEKYLFFPLYGGMENPLMTVHPQDWLVTMKKGKSDYTLRIQCCLIIYRMI